MGFNLGLGEVDVFVVVDIIGVNHQLGRVHLLGVPAGIRGWVKDRRIGLKLLVMLLLSELGCERRGRRGLHLDQRVVVVVLFFLIL